MYCRFNSAAATAARSASVVALSAAALATCVSYLLAGNQAAVEQVLEPCHLGLGVVGLRGVAGQGRRGLVQRDLERLRDRVVNRSWPALTSSPSAKCTFASRPVTWERTWTVEMASTVPTAVSVTGTDLVIAVAVTTGTGPVAAASAARPGPRAFPPPTWPHRSRCMRLQARRGTSASGGNAGESARRGWTTEG